MTVENARMRIAKIRMDLSYSAENLNNKLGLINEKDGNGFSTDEAINWLEIR